MGLFKKIKELRAQKYEYKIKKKEIRQNGLVDRKGLKTQALTAAYNNGIDPKAAAWGAASNMVQSASQLAKNIINPAGSALGGLGGNNNLFGGDSNGINKTVGVDLFGDKTIWIIMAAGIALILFLISKK